MTRDEIMMLDAEGVQQRISQVTEQANSPEADVTALTEELDALQERRNALKAAAAELRTKAAAVAAGIENEEVIATMNTNEMTNEVRYTAASPEYRKAFFLNLAGRDEEMTKEQRDAFVHTTANTTAPLPKQTLDTIWNLVTGQHCILGDVNVIRAGMTIEVVKHTAIVQGDAAVKGEGVANDDEQNTMIKAVLSGKDFTKHVDLSYAMERMSIESLEEYITSEIAAQLGEVMAADLVTTIGAGTAAANKMNTAGVKAIVWNDLTAAFASLKRVGAVTIYGSRKTIYTYLVGMVDANKRPIFQPNAQAGAEGVCLGAQVKVEDAVADNVLLIGDAKKVTYNMVQDVMIETARDIKKHVVTYSGYARGEGALIDDAAFAQLTVKQA